MRQILCAVLAVAICLVCFGAVKADSGTVVSFEKGKGLVVKIGDKETTIEMKGVKVIGADGKEIKGKDIADAFKKDAKVEVKKDGDKIVEITIK
jgi:hypothetical protein